MHRRRSFNWRALLAQIAGLVILATDVSHADLDRKTAEIIRAELAATRHSDFDDFLEAVGELDKVQGIDVGALRRGIQQATELSTSQRNDLCSLLGIYARLKYGDEALLTLAELVAIPTFKVESVPQYKNPEFLRFGALLGRIAGDFGLAFRNVDDRVYEISLGDARGELIGVHAHADVIPVYPDQWILEDGTRLDPFSLTRIGDRLYGRGAEDNKNGIVVALYAMRVVQEERLPLLRQFRLLVDTQEETGSDAMSWYLERNPVPDFNIAFDGSYPVVIAEKGWGEMLASFPVRHVAGDRATVVDVVGAAASNQIPAQATAWIRTTEPNDLTAVLNEKGRRFAIENGDNFRVRAKPGARGVRLDVLGVSAHSSEPGDGVNPVSRLFGLLDQLHADGLLEDNHFTDAASYAAENWGLDDLGIRAGIAYSDPFMGPLTATMTYVGSDDQFLHVGVNLRLPVGRTPGVLIADLSKRLDSWAAESKIDVTFKGNAGEPMYRDPEGTWLNEMLDIAVTNFGMPREFTSNPAYTSIHKLPNGVQFGLAMPNEKYTGHGPNEFKTVDQFLSDLSAVTELIARLGVIPEM